MFCPAQFRGALERASRAWLVAAVRKPRWFSRGGMAMRLSRRVVTGGGLSLVAGASDGFSGQSRRRVCAIENFWLATDAWLPLRDERPSAAGRPRRSNGPVDELARLHRVTAGNADTCIDGIFDVGKEPW